MLKESNIQSISKKKLLTGTKTELKSFTFMVYCLVLQRLKRVKNRHVKTKVSHKEFVKIVLPL